MEKVKAEASKKRHKHTWDNPAVWLVLLLLIILFLMFLPSVLQTALRF